MGCSIQARTLMISAFSFFADTETPGHTVC